MDGKVRNLNSLTKKIRNLSNLNIMPTIKDMTRKVQKSAKDIVQVDTGTLKNSIRVEFDNEKQIGYVKTNVEYAPYLEFGTVKMRAYPFMKPALDMNRREIFREIRKAIKEELRKSIK